MHAAAENLTPVTLELGGKSPCIVTEDAHIKLAAKRIMWGKLINAGQTCVAPDYVYVHRSVKERFLSAATSWVNEYYGSNPLDNPEYCKIINAAHYERIMGFIEGKIVCGGHGNGEKNRAYHHRRCRLDNAVYAGRNFRPGFTGAFLR